MNPLLPGLITTLAFLAAACSSPTPAPPAAARSAPPATDAATPTDGPSDAGDARPRSPLRLADFKPTSMLHALEHKVPRARFPVIDFHQHVDDRLGPHGLAFPPDQLITLMDQVNVQTLVVLTGPRGADLQRLIDTLVKPHPDRFVVFTQVDWSQADTPGFGLRAAAQLRADVGRGARGLKVLKELGLYARDHRGKLLAIDDPRWDPIWAECGRLGVPVAIHSGDPEAFFHPPDASNERHEELWDNPDWSFSGRDFPSLPALLAAQARVFARHPRTRFVALHFGGWPENLDHVSDLLARLKNVWVETGARQAELGRQPRRARRFFLEHSDRILFGTDMWPEPELYANYFRWLETADEYFPYYDYPAQGRWHIYGLDLPEAVLRKVYSENARALLTRVRE